MKTRYRGLLAQVHLRDDSFTVDAPASPQSLLKERVERELMASPAFSEFIIDKAIEILSDPQAKRLRGKMNKKLNLKAVADSRLVRGRSVKISPEFVERTLNYLTRHGRSRAAAIGEIAALYDWDRRAVNAALRRLKK